MTEDIDVEFDVPDLIYTLAEFMHEAGIPMGVAVRMAAEMLAEAMDQPDLYLDQITLH